MGLVGVGGGRGRPGGKEVGIISWIVVGLACWICWITVGFAGIVEGSHSAF